MAKAIDRVKPLKISAAGLMYSRTRMKQSESPLIRALLRVLLIRVSFRVLQLNHFEVKPGVIITYETLAT